MVSVTATRKAETATRVSVGGRPWHAAFPLRWWRRRHPFGKFTLTRRVLFVNMLAVVMLGGLMLYLDRYERGLIDTELQALSTQGGIFASALGEGAVLDDVGEDLVLVPSLAQGMVRRVGEPDRTRAQVFLPMPTGNLVADSRGLVGPGGPIQVEELPPIGKESNVLENLVDTISALIPARKHYPVYVERSIDRASDFPEVLQALDGHAARMVRADRAHGGLVLSVAVPVRRYKKVLGALLLSTGSAELEHQVNSVRTDIVRLFLFSLVFTFLLSLYLAGTIVRPVRRLAEAAQDVQYGDGRKIEIPDFSRRGDEIGELSVALNDMTRALWRRMDAIEHFAADVAHEIKNPLTSLRSAVETAARIKDPKQQQRLMAIILDDVQRLDRLISDISDASRLDSEMSRLERAPVAIGKMLAMLVDMHEARRDPAEPSIELRRPSNDPLIVPGKETRLVQVFRNLIANALSFSPPGSSVAIDARREGIDIVIEVDDQGPGIPEGKLAAIFDRFYSERPAGEKFGTHSGLGLSISKQIVEAHGGRITADNRLDAGGRVVGARFVVRLPWVDGLPA